MKTSQDDFEPAPEQEALDAPPHPYFAKLGLYDGPHEAAVNTLIAAAGRIARGAVNDGALLAFMSAAEKLSPSERRRALASIALSEINRGGVK
ncbi:MAG TPA: hypothetical protein VGG74_24575 [Kofleriaceae bacterium]